MRVAVPEALRSIWATTLEDVDATAPSPNAARACTGVRDALKIIVDAKANEALSSAVLKGLSLQFFPPSLSISAHSFRNWLYFKKWGRPAEELRRLVGYDDLDLDEIRSCYHKLRRAALRRDLRG